MPLSPEESIRKLGDYRFIDDLYFAIAQVAAEVVVTHKPGKVTVTLDIKPAQEGDPTIIITETIGKTPPKEAPHGAMFFVYEGALHREDPRQVRMEMVTVPPAESEVRQAPEEMPETRTS